MDNISACLEHGVLLTRDVQRDQLAADWAGVDRAPVLTVVSASDVTYLQVPVTDQWPDDGEARVVDDATILVRERNRTVVEPRHLHVHPAGTFTT